MMISEKEDGFYHEKRITMAFIAVIHTMQPLADHRWRDANSHFYAISTASYHAHAGAVKLIA